MKLYCNIESNLETGTPTWVIKEGPCELPESAGNVSNLSALDDATLKLFGWVPFERQSDNKSIIVSSEYEIREDCAIEKILTRDKTREELLAEDMQELSAKWEEIRNKRNKLLADSDKLVLSDRWEKLTDEEKISISNYRQSLRDISAQNDNPDLIIFPEL